MHDPGCLDTAVVRSIHRCRICGNSELPTIIDLGAMCLTSVFPRSDEPDPVAAPLTVVKCLEAAGGCGLVQLAHSVAPALMFGENDYGYRSGINESMRSHLRGIADQAQSIVGLRAGDLVLDIGSNDATLLNSYTTAGIVRAGIDPTAAQFKEYYPRDAVVVPTFFSRPAFVDAVESRQARVITSIAMLYDLEDPSSFVADLRSCLAPDGIWISEQSYLPLLIGRTAYDSICHEHLEYYALHQLAWLLERQDMKIIDASTNDMNGGSIRITATHRSAPYHASAEVARTLSFEQHQGFDRLDQYAQFRTRVGQHREALRDVVHAVIRRGETVYVYGASTKGNVILSYCGLDCTVIRGAADRNPRKHGRFTPGTRIPIVAEAEARAAAPGALLVLPWFFEREFVARERVYLDGGGTMIFPLPEVRVVRGADVVSV